LVPKSVTLNDLQQHSGYYFAYFAKFVGFKANLVKLVETRRDVWNINVVKEYSFGSI